jgi:hypothetical protein
MNMSESNANSMSTQVPIPLVDPEQMPREKAWSYADIAGIVGNLYLESRKRVSIMEEQFHAIMKEYQRKINELEGSLAQAMEENAQVRRELERRNEPRTRAVPDNVGQN